MPATLTEALKNLKADNVITQALGSHLLERFIEAKEIEWDMYKIQVHSWEREQYLSQY